MVNVDGKPLGKILGRHTRLAQTFTWEIGGVPVDLEADGYTVDVYVTQADGVTLGPAAATVAGQVATYQMATADLAIASSTAQQTARLVAVATNSTNRLVSDARTITVGEWGGSTDLDSP